jgi:Ni,Fe-hydrogenase III large subunit
METRNSLLRELAKEEYRIQNALNALGYYAYKIQFHTCGSISLEARELCGGYAGNLAALAANIKKYG